MVNKWRMMVTTKRLPIGRMGTVTDIAKGVVFLASPIPAL
jgi:NAD(P)-dependent dehydrogenase (short-subunit alcohol dehydrogenase family)